MTYKCAEMKKVYCNGNESQLQWYEKERMGQKEKCTVVIRKILGRKRKRKSNRARKCDWLCMEDSSNRSNL